VIEHNFATTTTKAKITEANLIPLKVTKKKEMEYYTKYVEYLEVGCVEAMYRNCYYKQCNSITRRMELAKPNR